MNSSSIKWNSSSDKSPFKSIEVTEKSRQAVTGYPDDIRRRLKMAAFSDTEEGNTYVKYVSPTNSDSNSKIATVEIQNDELIIDVEDVVGIVNLTPQAALQIDPKIGWGEILEMMKVVNQRRQSVEYRGIPVQEFLDDDIGIENIFIIVGLNYLESLEKIFKHGFIRSFEQRRRQGLDGRGRVDVEKSLMNFDLPGEVPRHEFVEKTIEYGIPQNDLIYSAGEELKQLFQLYASANMGESYVRIFSQLERAIQRLKSRGINGNSISIRDVPQVSLSDIPSQRRYYTDAFKISKAILSSAIGQPIDAGREELLMEYIIEMESLFEEYVAQALKNERDTLCEDALVTGLDAVSIEKKSYQLFTSDSLSMSSIPDHTIRRDGDPVAILDSKYYASDEEVINASGARSRLFSYGFHLQVDTLGMIAPLATPEVYRFSQRTGALHVLAPSKDEFTTEGLNKSIRDFLRQNIGEAGDIDLKQDIENREVCYPNISVGDIKDAIDYQELSIDQLTGGKILRYINKNRLSDELNYGNRGIEYLNPRTDLDEYINSYAEEYDFVIPFYIPSSDPESDKIQDAYTGTASNEEPDEFLRFYGIKSDRNKIIDIYTLKPFSVSW